MNRKPVAAGLFYSSSFGKLDKEIKECFTHKYGPGDFPIKRKDKKTYGIIAPHAGYKFSGPCAAWAYKELAESKFPKTYIILGPNHTGLGSDFSTYFFADWETPLGTVEVDKVLGKKLIKEFPSLKNEAEAHLEEHSIEVQLPFLQYVNKDKLRDIKFLPICIKSHDYKKLVALADAISEFEDISIICSSDFTHYGPSYGFVPFVHAVKDNLYRMDEKAISFIKKLDSKKFYNYAQKTTICGYSPIIVAIEACKILGAKRANLLTYYTSGDLSSYENAVGYAAMAFK